MGDQRREEDFFERLAAKAQPVASSRKAATPRLKARVYSALMRRQAESGPLLSISETRAAGRELCIFEELVRISPLTELFKSRNFCRVCHARVLAEKLENAPIYWHNCPYAGFQKQ